MAKRNLFINFTVYTCHNLNVSYTFIPPCSYGFVTFSFRFKEIESLPFFSGLDWSSIHNHPAPFVPRPDDITDTTYFNG